MRFIVQTVLLASLIVSCGASDLYAQNQPTLNQAAAGAVMVSGKASDAPVTVYDISIEPRRALGLSNSLDAKGNFAIASQFPLIAGHAIVVVDRQGTSSAVMVVAPRASSPSHR